MISYIKVKPTCLKLVNSTGKSEVATLFFVVLMSPNIYNKPPPTADPLREEMQSRVEITVIK